MIYTNVSFGNRHSDKYGLRHQRYGETIKNFIDEKKKSKVNIFLFRPAIPFLAYPTTYYSEITNSSYNWIPASFQSNNLIRIKLAKYSATGEYLGFFDAFDSHLQLCGHGYTDGRPAFTFGTVFNRTVNELKRWTIDIMRHGHNEKSFWYDRTRENFHHDSVARCRCSAKKKTIDRVSTFLRLTFVCLVFDTCRYDLEFVDVWNDVFRTLCVENSIWFDWKRKKEVRLAYLDIVFSQSNADQLIPTPVVIRNYRTATSTPNQNGEQIFEIFVFSFSIENFRLFRRRISMGLSSTFFSFRSSLGFQRQS